MQRAMQVARSRHLDNREEWHHDFDRGTVRVAVNYRMLASRDGSTGVSATPTAGHYRGSNAGLLWPSLIPSP